MLQFSRVHLSIEADNRLKMLKARTGLQPNLLCRIALCVSLMEPSPPDQRAFADDKGREMHRSTLFGQLDEVFCRLIEQRLWEYGQPTDLADSQVAGHVNRGIGMLLRQVKVVGDLASFLSEAT